MVLVLNLEFSFLTVFNRIRSAWQAVFSSEARSVRYKSNSLKGRQTQNFTELLLITLLSSTPGNLGEACQTFPVLMPGPCICGLRGKMGFQGQIYMEMVIFAWHFSLSHITYPLEPQGRRFSRYFPEFCDITWPNNKL